MAIILEMPKLSDTMKEGAIARWLKKEGESVTSGLPLLEIETDKATMEYESAGTGVLLKILVGDGQKCALQAPIAVIGKAGESWQEALAHYEDKKAKKGSVKGKEGDKKAPAATQTHGPTNSHNHASSGQAAASQAPASTHAPKASPLAKKRAADQGIDLQTITGSGPHGRIVQRDIEAYQSAPRSGSQGHAPAAVERVPLSMMRRTIAQRLTESVHTAPHFFLTVSCNMTNLLAWRTQTLKKLSAEQRFSVNDMMIFLVSKALLKHPYLNASWKEDAIELYRDVHMSVAVALPNGLVTPVIRDAHRSSILHIAAETKRLVALAKDGKLQPSDYQGGTFSISNLGMNGIEHFTAIINPPQSAILAVGATIPTPVVKEDGQIGVEQRMSITLSCDHRVIDGAVGSAFLATLKQYIEDPAYALFLA